MSDELRQLEDISLPHEDGWWALAYGDEAGRARALPTDIQARLYPHGVKYGPASEAVHAFIEASTSMRLDEHIYGAPAAQSMPFSTTLTKLPLTTDGFYDALLSYSNSSPSLSALSQIFYRHGDGVGDVKDDVHRGHIWAICWLITAPFVFTDDLWQRSEHLVDPVNEILAELNLPPLTWGQRNDNQL